MLINYTFLSQVMREASHPAVVIPAKAGTQERVALKNYFQKKSMIC